MSLHEPRHANNQVKFVEAESAILRDNVAGSSFDSLKIPTQTFHVGTARKECVDGECKKFRSMNMRVCAYIRCYVKCLEDDR